MFGKGFIVSLSVSLNTPMVSIHLLCFDKYLAIFLLNIVWMTKTWIKIHLFFTLTSDLLNETIYFLLILKDVFTLVLIKIGLINV